MQRRDFLNRSARLGVGTAAALASAGWTVSALAQGQASGSNDPRKPVVQVWKDPNCGCCTEWVKHLEANGFGTQTFDTGNVGIRRRLGMPDALGSCHTARAGTYVIEGHVPAADIHRLLREKPQALGLSVPRMPIGSPGMDGPEYGGRQDPYDVLLVLRDGTTRVFSSYPRA